MHVGMYWDYLREQMCRDSKTESGNHNIAIEGIYTFRVNVSSSITSTP